VTAAVVDDDVTVEVVDDLDLKALASSLKSLEWRLDNLYWIVDKDGRKTRFVMNDEQREFIQNIWPRNLILKARQLGFSTLMQVLQYDQALFNADHTGVVIADTLPNAGKLFGKVEYAHKHLAPALAEALPVKSSTSKSSIEFEHGSSIHVGTSARGGTVQLLHVSELGKIARKYPERAQEIVTGAFEAVPTDGCIVVESTAEGAAGEFWDLCDPAMKRLAAGEPETRMDWRLHFFPWFRSRDYRLPPDEAKLVQIPEKLARYFREVEALLGIVIDPGQRAWYAKKRETLGTKMKQEYPSTPQEAFEQAIEGAVYGEQMTWLREQGRLMAVPLDPAHKVNTFWDLGKRDKTAIWFMQNFLGQFRWVRYLHDSNRDLRHFWMLMEDWRREAKFQWGQHFLPHDAATERLGTEITTIEREMLALGMERTVVVPRISELHAGIELTRKALTGPHYFDKEGCAEGIKCLDGYQYEWNDKLGVWGREPLHNWASHGSDAWRMFAEGWDAFSASNDAAFNTFKNRKRSWR
jgi:hypothetical protein